MLFPSNDITEHKKKKVENLFWNNAVLENLEQSILHISKVNLGVAMSPLRQSYFAVTS